MANVVRPNTVPRTGLRAARATPANSSVDPTWGLRATLAAPMMAASEALRPSLGKSTMNKLLLGLALAGVLTGAANAQTVITDPKRGDIVPTEQCLPWTKYVILGLCTRTQMQEAKAMAEAGIQQTKAHPASPPPPKGQQDLTVRFHSEDLAGLDAWIAAQPDKPDRAEAIRRLVKRGLGS